MWQEIIRVVLPLLVGFDLYIESPSGEFKKINPTHYKSVDYSGVEYIALASSNLKLAPYETEEPVKELEAKLRGVNTISVIKLINRTGPFYGWYLRLERLN